MHSDSERWIGFVRAVMVGREGLTRDRLLDAFIAVQAEIPISHLATGNVSFNALDGGSVAAEAAELITDTVGRRIDVVVRAIDHLRELDRSDPFAASPFDPTRDRLVTFFPAVPRLPWTLPREEKGGRVCILSQTGADVFSVTRDVNGSAAAPGGLLEKAAGLRATTRAWSTIRHILDRHA